MGGQPSVRHLRLSAAHFHPVFRSSPDPAELIALEKAGNTFWFHPSDSHYPSSWNPPPTTSLSSLLLPLQPSLDFGSIYYPEEMDTYLLRASCLSSSTASMWRISSLELGRVGLDRTLLSSYSSTRKAHLINYKHLI